MGNMTFVSALRNVETNIKLGQKEFQVPVLYTACKWPESVAVHLDKNHSQLKVQTFIYRVSGDYGQDWGIKPYKKNKSFAHRCSIYSLLI